MYVYTYIHTHTHTHVCMYVCIYIRMHVCMYACMCVRVCVSSIDMYNNDVGKESAQKFMKQTGDLKGATLYFAS